MGYNNEIDTKILSPQPFIHSHKGAIYFWKAGRAYENRIFYYLR